MKNKMLALVALCSATSSTMPLWAVEWNDPVLEFAVPDLKTDGTGGGIYYIYHVATQKFMCNGNYKNNWSTELVVADEGQEITLSYGDDYELSRRPETDPEYSNEKGWRLSMKGAPSNGGFHELFIRAASMVICVDHNKQGHMLWQIMPQENGTYRIKIIDGDKLYGVEVSDGIYKNSYVAVNEGENGVNPVLDPETAGYMNAGLDWKFVTPEAYGAYKAKLKLQDALEKADEAGFTDYAEYADIYDNPDATAEETEKAVEKLSQAIIDFKYNAATEVNPMDVTELIVNPMFDGNTNGWVSQRDAVPSGAQDNFGYTSGTITTSDGVPFTTCFQRWNSKSQVPRQPDWSVTQDLTGLPDGKYQLKAYILTNVTGMQPEGRFLVAKTLAGEKRTEANVPSPDGSAYAVPYTVDFSVIGGTATIGMIVENCNSNWSSVSNFSLQYYGKSGAATFRDALLESIADAEKKYEEYTEAHVTFSNVGEKKYEETIQSAKVAAENQQIKDEDLRQVIDMVQARMDSLSLDIVAYESLNAQRLELEKAYDENPYSENGLEGYESFLDDLQEAYEHRTFDPNEVDSIQSRANRIFKSSVLELLRNGGTTDVTGLFVNPDFTSDNTGWTKTGNGEFKHANEVAEVWNGTDFEVCQEVTDLPEGTYKITMQGFYSPSSTDKSWQSSWGTEGDELNEVKASLFGNDVSVKLHHVLAYPQTEDIADNCEQVFETGVPAVDGMWFCHGTSSAHEIFGMASDNYQNTVNCYVTDEGRLRIGVKMAGATLKGAWALFDHFEVEYLGAEDMSGATSVISALIEEAAAMRDEELQLTTREARKTLSVAVESASAVLDQLTLETYKEQMASLNAAIAMGKEALEAASALEGTVYGHDAKMQSEEGGYSDYVGTPEFDEFEALIIELLGKIESNENAVFESVAEIEEYNVKITKAYANMVVSHMDLASASIGTPLDMTSVLMTPCFSDKDEEGGDVNASDGWVSSLDGGKAENKDLVYEFYDTKSCDLHQTLYHLPKGYYRVVYNGLYRAGELVSAALVRRDSADSWHSEAYVKAGQGKWSEKLQSIFDGVSEYKYDTSDRVLADSLFPDSPQLLYHCTVDSRVGARTAFEAGEYEGNFCFQVSEEGQDVVLGVCKNEYVKNDWLCFDNFRLYYLGDGDANKPDDFVDSVDDVMAEGTLKVVDTLWYTIDGVHVSAPNRRGIYIREDRMEDGSKRTRKIMVK